MNHLQRLKEMFREMVVKKDLSGIPKYYHPDFKLYTNMQETNYRDFLESHEKYYASPIQYKVQYNDESFLEQGDKVAGSMWITIARPGEPPRRIEVTLIVQYKEGKIFRIWETTYPDWSQMPAFK